MFIDRAACWIMPALEGFHKAWANMPTGTGIFPNKILYTTPNSQTLRGSAKIFVSSPLVLGQHRFDAKRRRRFAEVSTVGSSERPPQLDGNALLIVKFLDFWAVWKVEQETSILFCCSLHEIANHKCWSQNRTPKSKKSKRSDAYAKLTQQQQVYLDTNLT